MNKRRVFAVAVIATAAALAATSVPAFAAPTGSDVGAASLPTPMLSPGMVTLADGTVLIAGDNYGSTATYVYNPVANNYSTKGNLPCSTATQAGNRSPVLLSSGKVFYACAGAAPAIYDPSSGTWSLGPQYLEGSLGVFGETKLSDGRVLIDGGIVNNNFSAPSSTHTEIYDPTSNSFSYGPNLAEPRSHAPAVLLANGKVLVAGGYAHGSDTTQLSSAEVLNLPTNSSTEVAAMPSGAIEMTEQLLPSGKVLVVGGGYSRLYDPTANTWSSTGAMVAIPSAAPLVPLYGGSEQLLMGGAAPSNSTAVQVYDASTNAWSEIATVRNDPSGALIETTYTSGVAVDGGTEAFTGGGTSGTTHGNSATHLFSVTAPPAPIDYTQRGYDSNHSNVTTDLLSPTTTAGMQLSRNFTDDLRPAFANGTNGQTNTIQPVIHNGVIFQPAQVSTSTGAISGVVDMESTAGCNAAQCDPVATQSVPVNASSGYSGSVNIGAVMVGDKTLYVSGTGISVYGSCAAAASPCAPLFTIPVNGTVAHGMTVAGSRVYVPTTTGLYVYDLNNCSASSCPTAWQDTTFTGPNRTGLGVSSTPAVANGNVYISTSSGYMLEYTDSTCSGNCRAKLTADFGTTYNWTNYDGVAPVYDAANNAVYVVDPYRGVVALDGTTGNTRWVDVPTTPSKLVNTVIPGYSGNDITLGDGVLTINTSGLLNVFSTTCASSTCGPQWTMAATSTATIVNHLIYAYQGASETYQGYGQYSYNNGQLEVIADTGCGSSTCTPAVTAPIDIQLNFGGEPIVSGTGVYVSGAQTAPGGQNVVQVPAVEGYTFTASSNPSDTTAPYVTYSSMAPPLSSRGYAASPSVITWGAYDNGANITPPPTSTISAQGINIVTSRLACDSARNCAADTYQFTIDTVGPTGTVAPSPAPNAAGWNNTPVKETYSCSDSNGSLSTSGVATCPSVQTYGSEGANQTVSGTASDYAGNSATITGTPLNIDLTKPTLSIAATPLPNAAGWYSGPVTIQPNCADALSGIASCSAAAVLNTDGAGQAATFTAVDKAGNSTTATSSPINIDSHAPQSTASLACSGGGGYCTGGQATVHIAATDVGPSGVASITYAIGGGSSTTVTGSSTDVTVPLPASGSVKVTYYAVDVAGNAEPVNTVTVRADNISPSISHTISPAPNAAGWNDSATTVHWDATDDGGSGVASVSPDATVSSETSSTVLTGTATDNAGNSASDPVTLKVDSTPPTVAATLSGTTGDDGFYTSAVTAHFTCADDLSGVASCPSDYTFTRDGASQTVTVTATDVAGNTVSFTTAPVSIDTTAPTLTQTPATQPNAAGWYDTAVTIHTSCADAGSGIADCSADQTVTDGANQTVTSTATDEAGNTASATTTVSVDTTAPSVSTTASGPVGDNGWYTGPVTIHSSCSDGLSGVANCTGDQVISGDGTGQSVSATGQDVAGNVTTVTSSPVSIDSEAPQSTASLSCTGGNGFCRGSSATVTLASTDVGPSGVATITYAVGGGSPVTVDGDSVDVTVPLPASGTTALSFYATDLAGNVEAANEVDVRADNISPSISHTVLPTPNAAGWDTSSTTVHFTASDDGGSGLATVSPDTTVDTETAGQTITGTATDGAGNSSTDSVDVKLDTTAPTVSATYSGTKGSNGWYVGPVTAHFTCSDPNGSMASGVANCPADYTFVSDGASQTTTVTATDVAGNSTSFTTAPVNIDGTAPVLTYGLSGSQGQNGWYTSAVTVSWSCSDATSHIAGSCPAGATLAAEGANQTATAAVADNAGNRTAVTTVPVKIDTKAATAAITTASSPLLTSSSTVKGTATDATSGVASVTVTYKVTSGSDTNKVVVFACNTGGGATCNWTAAPTLKAGVSYSVTAVANDVAGNAGTSTSPITLANYI